MEYSYVRKNTASSFYHKINVHATISARAFNILVILAHRIRISEILHWDRRSYLTHAILPRTSSNVIM